KRSKIVIARGSELFVDGGQLTSLDNFPWHGIEVWGNSNQSQLVTQQGWVRVINGGTIENSNMGIYTNRPLEMADSGWEPGYTGGIVQAIDAKFINNKTALQFFPYNFPSVSGFTNCEFITNLSYPGSQPPDYFAKITGMNGVKFSHCNFVNETGIDYYQSGIRSVNSYIKIEGKCLDASQPCTNWEYSLFEGLKYGIYATATGPTRFVDIRHTEFDNNFRGLYLSGITNARVTSNRFIINTPFAEEGGYGLYLDASTGYWIEDNDFLHEHEGEIQKGIGLIVNNSGSAPNEIYRNRFENLQMGISAQGRNRHPVANQGLQILCNDFTVCQADLLVVAPLPDKTKFDGIAPKQGAAMPNNPMAMAGNMFHVYNQP
ncbi:MAG: NosD domain-containing protein, partial [Candidatus Subteraquimicrobiales bacterium]|nr:NosD domain-containing protein [Candidatus Subteraquimicrobiales bacterium]